MKKLASFLLALTFISSLFVFCTGPASAAEAHYFMRKISIPPTINGSFSESEWGAPTYTLKASDYRNNDYITKVGPIPESLVNSFEFSTYYRWDNQHLYVAAVSKNSGPHKFNTDIERELVNIWQTECVQMMVDLNEAGSVQGGYAEYVMGASTDFSKLFQWCFSNPSINKDRFPTGMTTKDVEFAVAPSANNGLVYEMKVAWAKIDAQNTGKVKEGAKIRSSFSFNFEPGFAGICYSNSPLDQKSTYSAPKFQLVGETYTAKSIPVESIKLKAKTTQLDAGETSQITAEINPVNATDLALDYSSSDPKIATVDKNGNVKGLKQGAVTITATAKNGIKTTTQFSVTGSLPEEPSTAPPVVADPSVQDTSVEPVASEEVSSEPDEASSVEDTGSEAAEKKADENNTPWGLIIGIVVGIVVLAGIAIVIVMMLKKKKAQGGNALADEDKKE